MGQIVGLKAKPKRANLNALSLVPTPAAGEYILVSSDNSMQSDGQGNFDAYVVGDGVTAAPKLELLKINKEYVEKYINVTSDYTITNGHQAYGNVGEAITIASNSTLEYVMIAATLNIRVKFATTSNTNILSLVQYVDNNGIITRRAFLKGDYTAQKEYTYIPIFEEGESAVYITGASSSIVVELAEKTPLIDYAEETRDMLVFDEIIKTYTITSSSSSFSWIWSERFAVNKGDWVRYKLIGKGNLIYYYSDTTTPAANGTPLLVGKSDSDYESGELQINDNGYIAIRPRINIDSQTYGIHYRKLNINEKVEVLESAVESYKAEIEELEKNELYDKFTFDLSTSNAWRSSSYIKVHAGDILYIYDFVVQNNANMVVLYSDMGTTVLELIATGTGKSITAKYIMGSTGYLWFRNQNSNGSAELYLQKEHLVDYRKNFTVNVPFNGTTSDRKWKNTKPYPVKKGDQYEVNLMGSNGAHLYLYEDESLTTLISDLGGSSSLWSYYVKLVGTIESDGYIFARAAVSADDAYCHIIKQSLNEYLSGTTSQGRNIIIASSTSAQEDKNVANVVCTGTHDEETIQSVIDMMGEYGVVYFKSGVYYIDGFKEDVNGGPSYAIRVPYPSNFRFIGDIFSCTHNDLSNLDAYNGVRFSVTKMAYDSCSDTGLYAVFGGTKAKSGDDAHVIMEEGLSIENVSVILYGNQKPIICFDGWNLGWMRISQFYAAGPSNNRGSINAIGIDNCIGIRGHQGSNNGANSVFESGYIIGLGVGCSVCGEHTKWVDIDCIGNKYAYWVNQFYDSLVVGVYTHSITMIGCTDEVSTRFMRFGKNPRRQTIEIFNLTIEFYPSNFALDGHFATEDFIGQWYGHVDYAIQEFEQNDAYYLKNTPTKQFWENGHGIQVRSTNNAQQQVVTSSELSTYAPNYNQIVYVSDLQKALICTNPATREWRDLTGTVVPLT